MTVGNTRSGPEDTRATHFNIYTKYLVLTLSLTALLTVSLRLFQPPKLNRSILKTVPIEIGANNNNSLKMNCYQPVQTKVCMYPLQNVWETLYPKPRAPDAIAIRKLEKRKKKQQ